MFVLLIFSHLNNEYKNHKLLYTTADQRITKHPNKFKHILNKTIITSQNVLIHLYCQRECAQYCICLFFLFCRYLYPFELHEKETLKPSVKEEVIERNSRDKNIKPESPESPPDSSDEKHLECLEPSLDIDEDHEEVIVKKQSTRIKEMKRQQSRDLENSMLSESQTKSPEEDVSVDVVNSPESSSDVSEPQSDSKSDIPVDENTFEVGDKIQVKYGRGRNHRLYDAKVRFSTVKSR